VKKHDFRNITSSKAVKKADDLDELLEMMESQHDVKKKRKKVIRKKKKTKKESKGNINGKFPVFPLLKNLLAT
jgi:hypothetical protein